MPPYSIQMRVSHGIDERAMHSTYLLHIAPPRTGLHNYLIDHIALR
jgi:hypothetical protein